MSLASGGKGRKGGDPTPVPPIGHPQHRLNSQVPTWEPSCVATCLSPLSGQSLPCLPFNAGPHCLSDQSVLVFLEVPAWIHFRTGVCSNHGGVFRTNVRAHLPLSLGLGGPPS